MRYCEKCYGSGVDVCESCGGVGCFSCAMLGEKDCEKCFGSRVDSGAIRAAREVSPVGVERTANIL